VTGYERGTFEERSARTESSPRQSRKNSENDSRANNNIRETLGILSLPTMAPNGIKNVLVLDMASGFAVTRAPEYPE